MTLNNLRPKVGKQNLAKCCFSVIIVSVVVMLAGVICLAIGTIGTRKGSSLGSMEKSKQFVRKQVENTGTQADDMICSALGYCGKTFQTYLDPEADNEQFKSEFQQLQTALLRADFMNPVISAIQNALNGTGITDLLSQIVFPVAGLPQEPDFYASWKTAAENIISYFKNGQADLDRVHGLWGVVDGAVQRLQTYGRDELSDTIEKL